MDRNLFSPPSISRTAESFTEMLAQAGKKNEEAKKNQRQALAAFLEMGRWLNQARPYAKDDWEASLKDHGISSQRASDAMWGANQPRNHQAEWESISDLRKARGEESGAAKSAIPQKGDAPPKESEIVTPVQPAKSPSVVPPPVEPKLKCPDCQRKGWKPFCPQCLLLNKPSTTSREPGEDDGEIDAIQEIAERHRTEEDQLIANTPLPDGTRPQPPQAPLAGLYQAIRQQIDNLKADKDEKATLYRLLKQFEDCFQEALGAKK